MPTYQQFPLPDAGEGLTEAEIVTWHVAVGDRVEVNQTIVEIETAKSLVDLPCPWTGVVTRLLVDTGTTVEVGTPIIEVDVDPDGAAPEPVGTGDARADGARAHHPHPSRSSAEPGGADEVGAARDELQAPVGADGPASGAPAAGGGSGAVLVGYGVADGGSARRPRRPAAPRATSSAAAPARPAASPARPAAPARPDGTQHALAKPPVRKLARDLGVDLDAVTPTGPGSIVTREDVLAHAVRAEGRALATYPGDDRPWAAGGTVSPDGRQTRVPVKSVRKRTAEAMVSSAFSAPHVTVFHTVDVTRTMKLVERLRSDREFADVRVTPLLIAAKALLLAVDRHPEINASWDEAQQEIVYKHYVNLGIAATTPRGLVVPNIKDAHRLDLLSLARGLGELTATARAGRASPADMSDGTITITNVGVFGIDTGTPILNPGESAILAFGAIRQQPWVHKGKVKPRNVTQLALSFDHRLVDGELGSRVLADVAAVLADPAQALVWG
ncbi:2-oxo acid dehydrogenase subunit E2 [Cellulomonas sp. zg-ZUI199]|uniref:Dihydrolipoamide acetyltransferase component of pyruvate dehydrogenase complex n=1 Tax=Cellulomonas wangleii TaxID=2816956 RepID=A0ABX8D400_9CELL|nr:dihydrolipoamide acetyltransferase family protein [Cellulomonas wangleii]MBO0923886.1 2-oxo acid dehydrogenase subunit E2 [Cellulomonas wangleii]MBO0924168.1 2-oxo acid dehydrogenase subunit E2 [Cellulomonas wangleii]QVI62190.1 2-oxo acid dehydrogenase subunit E2 [Cellulomonas wangleii]